MDSSSITQRPLGYRCLALTGAFETSAPPPDCFGVAAGNFDGQGISFSALQWNLGQGTLQPLPAEIIRDHAGVVESAFGPHYQALAHMLSLSRPEQLDWARSIQTSRDTLDEPWPTCFHDLGQTAEFQAVALSHAAALFQAALGMCTAFGLHSQRAAALFFDIRVQNGGIGTATEQLIHRDFAALPVSGAETAESSRLAIVANRVADNARPQFQQDVRSRKLAIANGTGIVHHVKYDLATQFGLTLAPI